MVEVEDARKIQAASSLSQSLFAAINPNSALVLYSSPMGYGLRIYMGIGLGLCMVYSYGDGPLMD